MSFLITFEGVEGAGKSTQIKLVREYLNELGLNPLVVREPGGTSIGNQIRNILLNPHEKKIKMKTEILLYAASRAQLVEELIVPALKSGRIVLCDRYIDSSVAYQGYGARVDQEEILLINRIATGGLVPDRTYLLDIPLELSGKRIDLRGERKDRMELKKEPFHHRVREGYLQIADENRQRIKVINANKKVHQVFSQIMDDLILLLRLPSK